MLQVDENSPLDHVRGVVHSKASALVRTLCLLVRFPQRSVFAVGELPCQKAVVPSLVARAEVRVVHHVVVADALACAWGRQRGHPVEVTAFFNREVPSPEPCLGQRGILLFELYSLHLLNLKGPSFCRHSSYWSSSSRPGA